MSDQFITRIIKTNSKNKIQIGSYLNYYVNTSIKSNSISHSNIFNRSYKKQLAENIDIPEAYDRRNNDFYQEESDIEDFFQEYLEVECEDFVSEKVILKVIWDKENNIPKILFEDLDNNTLDAIENNINILEMFLAYQSGFIKNLLSPDNQTEEGLVKAIRKLKYPISMDPKSKRFIFFDPEQYLTKYSASEADKISDESLFEKFFTVAIGQKSGNYKNFIENLNNTDKILKNALKEVFLDYLSNTNEISDKNLINKIKNAEGMSNTKTVLDYTCNKFKDLKDKKNKNEMKFNIDEHISKINYLKEKFPKPWKYFNELYTRYSDDLENFSLLFTYPFKNLWIEFNWKESGKEKFFVLPVTFIVNGLIPIENDEGQTKQTNLAQYSHPLKDLYSLLTHLKNIIFDINVDRAISLKNYILSDDIKDFINDINIGDVKYDLNQKRSHIIKRCKTLIENHFLPLADSTFLDEMESIKNIKETELKTKFSSKEAKNNKKNKKK